MAERCKCGAAEATDAHGSFACWRCYAELLEAKNRLARENYRLREELHQMQAAIAVHELQPQQSTENRGPISVLCWDCRDYARDLKDEVLLAYGGRCVCCGVTDREFLTVDHINGDGAAQGRVPER